MEARQRKLEREFGSLRNLTSHQQKSSNDFMIVRNSNTFKSSI